jgi:hypothetical protein
MFIALLNDLVSVLGTLLDRACVLKKCDRHHKICTPYIYGETGHGNFGTTFGLNISGLNIGKLLPKTKTGFLFR